MHEQTPPPEHSRPPGKLQALGEKLVDLCLHTFHAQFALGKHIHQAAYRPPTELAANGFPGLAGFKSAHVYSAHPGKEHKTFIGLWHKPATAPDKPIYLLFHGRDGHWGHCGDPRNSPAPGFNPQFRLRWLETMAETGAEIIAVHTPGFGMSADGSTALGTDLSEKSLRDDMKAIAGYLGEHHIDPRRLVVAGESLGGAMAMLMAGELTRRGQPPAVLGMINSFESMPKALQPHAAAATLLGWTMDPQVSERRIARVVPERFKNGSRLRRLDRQQTRLYLAHAPADQRVAYENAERLCARAEALGLACTLRKLEGEHLIAEGRFPHTHWNPHTIAQDLEAAFQAHGVDAPTGKVQQLNGNPHSYFSRNESAPTGAAR